MTATMEPRQRNTRRSAKTNSVCYRRSRLRRTQLPPTTASCSACDPFPRTSAHSTISIMQQSINIEAAQLTVCCAEYAQRAIAMPNRACTRSTVCRFIEQAQSRQYAAQCTVRCSRGQPLWSTGSVTSTPRTLASWALASLTANASAGRCSASSPERRARDPVKMMASIAV